MTPEDTRRRVAVVLFNLGGPDSPAAIGPFLRNLFSDPAILRVPFFVRPFLARLIARRRLAPARANYALLGGRSPLLEMTEAQAAALSAVLNEVRREDTVRCFVAMRYWHPFSAETAWAVKQWAPDRVVLLPLYPHFSTTTTGSSLDAWRKAACDAGLVADVTSVCCYPADRAFIDATVAGVGAAWAAARTALDPAIPLRVLFSAHGLPETIVRGGDPYQWQIERCVAAVLDAWDGAAPDHAICYQSRATPQKWLEPSTEQEIARAARDQVALLVVPIAFVSEHSETLVELDIEYRHLAEKLGVPGYFRVPTQNVGAGFIAALARLVGHALDAGPGLCAAGAGRLCPVSFRGCPLAA
ncbi:MAG: ferrochelatase [Rhodospirillales bacterium]|nr:ferrochelatase [Rhodospirillales bacterium]